MATSPSLLARLRPFGLQGYILFAPFTAWLSLTGWLRPPVDFILLALLGFVPLLWQRFIRRPGSFLMAEEDVLLIGLCLLAWASYCFGSLTPKSFNHAFSYTFVIGVFLLLFKRMWKDARLSIEQLFKMAFYAVLLADLIVIIEWSLLNFFYILIRHYFIIAENVTNMDYYDQSFFKSVGGTSEEPSLFCFNVNALFPLGWYYLTQQKRPLQVGLFVCLHMATLVMTASSGGIGFMVIALSIAYGLEAKAKQVASLAWGFLLVVILALVTYSLLPIEIKVKADAFSHQIVSKMLFENASADMREEAWKKGVSDFEAAPWLGRGPAYGHEAYHMFGYQSWYFKLLAETGLFSLLLVWSFLAIIWVKIWHFKHPLRRFLIISFVASTLHWAIADCYYHVSFWIVICSIQLMVIETKEEKAKAIALAQ